LRGRTPLRNQAETDPDFPDCHRLAIPGQGCCAVQPLMWNLAMAGCDPLPAFGLTVI